MLDYKKPNKKPLKKTVKDGYVYIGELQLAREIIPNPCILPLHMTKDMYTKLTRLCISLGVTQDEYIRCMLAQDFEDSKEML